MEKKNIGKIKTKSFYLIMVILITLLVPLWIEAEPLELLIYRGNKNYQRANYEEALKYYLQAEKRQDKTYRATYNKANALYKLENYREAEKAYTEVINTKKNRLKRNAYFNLGNTYFLLGEYEKAVNFYIKTLEIDPYDMDAKYNLELASRKMEEQEKESNKNNKPDESNEKEKKISENRKAEDRNKQETSSPQLNNLNREQEKITPQEAEKIIKSVENNNKQILKKILLQKVRSEDEEQDW